MDRVSASHEMRRLLQEAVPVMGERWVALGAGCHPCSVQSWLNRKETRLQDRTMAEVLPRLRHWKSWAPVYRAVQAEIRQLKAENGPIKPPVVSELQSRLVEALRTYPLRRVAVGCEVSENLVVLWSLGQVSQQNRDDVLKALGALRYVDRWPGAQFDPIINESA